MIGSIIKGIVNALISPLIDALFTYIIAPFVELVLACFLPIFVTIFMIIMMVYLWLFGLVYAMGFWQIVKSEIVLAFTIGLLTELLVANILLPRIDFLATNLAFALPLVFNIALLVMGMTYVLAAFWVKKLNLVDWKRAIAWLLAGIFFYTYTLEIFNEFEETRRESVNLVYTIVLELQYGSNGNTVDWANGTYTCNDVSSELTTAIALYDIFTDATDNSTNTTATQDNAEWGCLSDWFGGTTSPDNSAGTYLAYDRGIDAVDITLAFVMATPNDMLSAIPQAYFEYFFVDQFIDDFVEYFVGGDGTDGVFERALDGIENTLSGFPDYDGSIDIDLANLVDTTLIGSLLTAWGRMYGAQYMGLIAIVEQTVYMIYTMGYGIVFWAFLLFLPLAFFLPTEKFAMAAVKQMVEMFWSFLFSQFMIALAIGIMIAGTGLRYPPAIMAFAFVAACPTLIALMTAINAFWGMIKGLSSVVSSAAAQGVEQGFAMTKGLAKAKFGGVAGKLKGIAGADKAIGPGSGSSALGGGPGGSRNAFGGGGGAPTKAGSGAQQAAFGGSAGKQPPKMFGDKGMSKKSWGFWKEGGKRTLAATGAILTSTIPLLNLVATPKLAARAAGYNVSAGKASMSALKLGFGGGGMGMPVGVARDYARKKNPFVDKEFRDGIDIGANAKSSMLGAFFDDSGKRIASGGGAASGDDSKSAFGKDKYEVSDLFPDAAGQGSGQGSGNNELANQLSNVANQLQGINQSLNSGQNNVKRDAIAELRREVRTGFSSLTDMNRETRSEVKSDLDKLRGMGEEEMSKLLDLSQKEIEQKFATQQVSDIVKQVKDNMTEKQGADADKALPAAPNPSIGQAMQQQNRGQIVINDPEKNKGNNS